MALAYRYMTFLYMKENKKCVRKLYKGILYKLYSGRSPYFDEGDIFKITIHLKNIATVKVVPDSESAGQGEVDLQELINLL